MLINFGGQLQRSQFFNCPLLLTLLNALVRPMIVMYNHLFSPQLFRCTGGLLGLRLMHWLIVVNNIG